MTTQQPEALRLAHVFDHPIPPEWSDMVAAAAELRRLHAYCQELESQVILDCMTHVQNPAEIEHVAGNVSKNGAGLNTSTQNARITELESQLAQRFDAADMATASAQGFRDGAASLTAQAADRAIEGCPELNMGNYDEVDVERLNDWAIRANDEIDRLHALAAGQATAAQQPDSENLRKALQFYADSEHFIKSDGDAWDTVSDEPQNYWCDEAGTATVEDGHIARLALSGHPVRFEDDAA